VAIAALVHARVKFVAEFDVPRVLQLEIYILDGMTLYTFFSLKGFFAVMTGAAGLPFFHLGHGDRLFCRHIVDLGVADGAFISAEMLLVTEGHRPRFFYFNSDIRNLVTLDAIIEIEGPFAVVAGAAGLAFFHICHGVTVLASEVENGVMAGLAVIFNAFLSEVLVVAKYHLAEIGCLKGDIFDVNCISEGAG